MCSPLWPNLAGSLQYTNSNCGDLADRVDVQWEAEDDHCTSDPLGLRGVPNLPE